MVYIKVATVLAALAAACATSAPEIPKAWLSTPETARVALRSNPPAKRSPIRVESNRLYNSEKALTPAYAAVDSVDYSEERGEAVFSAKRNGSFDIGLVSDGTRINWVPEDPADEVAVQWAPRGNKVSFVVKGRAGDLVRTVHIPTASQLTVDFPYATVRGLVWDPDGERFSVAYDAVDASEQVETMRFGGTERKVTTPPAVRLDVSVESLPGAWLMRPSSLRYGERLPLVVWLTGNRNAWSDARGSLQRQRRIGCAVASKLDDALLTALTDLPWVDKSRLFVVNGRGTGAISIVGDPRMPGGRYRREGNIVRVPPAVVESFATGFIASQLKGNAPPDGSLR
ncbi:MAG TPA: hypothetical protein VGR02_13010 [Thermoanaerobaculia bacterium]|nr:hypothetical protein [Thermoanaerobaculia bacterium]